jgi:recombination protein RecA
VSPGRPARKAAGVSTGVASGSRDLAGAAAKIREKYGKERTRQVREHVIVPTGSFALDWALRVGGFELGRIYEIFGAPGAGKSSLAISSMIQHARMFPGRGVAYVDMENTFDEDRAAEMGLDCSEEAEDDGRWFHAYPEHSEHVSDMTRDLIVGGFYSVIVVDSIGAMESDRVLGKSAADAADAMGRNAKIITQMNKALGTLARLNQCTVLLVNQPRAPVGSMIPMDVSAGPKHMQHVTTSKLDMKALGGEENTRSLRLPGETDDLKVSIKTRINIPRLKNGLPGRVAEVYLNRVGTDQFGPPGFDVADEALSLGTSLKVIRLGGSYYTMPDEKRLNGKGAALAYLRENPGLVRMIRDSVLFDKPTDCTEDDQEEGDGNAS